MSDAETTVAALREMLRQFVAERQWEPFHTPKNLAMSLAIEAAELMEHFQWLTPEQAQAVGQHPERLSEVADELSDVLAYCLALANTLELDLSDSLRAKMVKNRQKYPADRFRGRYGDDDRPDAAGRSAS